MPCVVRGDYVHPDLQLVILRAGYTLAEYTGKRVDNNTIDGNLLRLDEVIALQLVRKRYADEAG